MDARIIRHTVLRARTNDTHGLSPSVKWRVAGHVSLSMWERSGERAMLSLRSITDNCHVRRCHDGPPDSRARADLAGGPCRAARARRMEGHRAHRPRLGGDPRRIAPARPRDPDA